jgi:hypothetical protein
MRFRGPATSSGSFGQTVVGYRHLGTLVLCGTVEIVFGRRLLSRPSQESVNPGPTQGVHLASRYSLLAHTNRYPQCRHASSISGKKADPQSSDDSRTVASFSPPTRKGPSAPHRQGVVAMLNIIHKIPARTSPLSRFVTNEAHGFRKALGFQLACTTRNTTTLLSRRNSLLCFSFRRTRRLPPEPKVTGSNPVGHPLQCSVSAGQDTIRFKMIHTRLPQGHEQSQPLVRFSRGAMAEPRPDVVCCGRRQPLQLRQQPDSVARASSP